MNDVGMLFSHLPLSNVEHVDLHFHEWINSHDYNASMMQLQRALKRMRFPRLEILTTKLTVEVVMARRCLWTDIESALAKSLQQDTITRIQLSVEFMFTGCANVVSGEEIFLSRVDSHDDISPKLMPTQDRLQQLFRTLENSCKNLRSLNIHLTGESTHEGHDDNFDLLTFRLMEDSSDDTRLSTGTAAIRSVQSTNRYLDFAYRDRTIEYNVHHEEIDQLAH